MGLLQIAKSWATWVQGDPYTKKLMADRLAICDTCDQRGTVGPLEYCKICTCPLAGKTAHPMNECPLGKWKNTGDQSYF